MSNPVRMTELFRFWVPLQATWLMMSLEGPFLAAVIARLAEPKHNLAAYGVAFALAILVEAPVIMMMSASTALVDSAGIYRRLRNFMWILNIGITLAMLVLLFTPLWDLLTDTWMGLDEEVARLTRVSLYILMPWPAAIGYRRFYQGLLIRNGLTRRVAWGTLIRLAAMVVTALICRATGDMAGAWVGAAALTGGVCTEAVASRFMAAGIVRSYLGKPSGEVMSYRGIFDFYLPLALTSTIALAVQPMVTFFMGQARFSLESLAVLPVVNSLVFIFRSPGLSYQEAAITMLGRGDENYPSVRRFAVLLGLGSAAGLALIAWTPLSQFWLQTVSGLTTEMATFALTPIRILTFMPILAVLLAFQRSLLVAYRNTGPITWASAIEVVGILTVLFITIRLNDWVGATAAATAFMIGRLLANLFLLPKTHKSQ
jgi:hypothetical protein